MGLICELTRSQCIVMALSDTFGTCFGEPRNAKEHLLDAAKAYSLVSTYSNVWHTYFSIFHHQIEWFTIFYRFIPKVT